jgi:two-component system LytT family response regulator
VKVLIVDDEPVARRRLARMCARVPGIEVAGEAADGREAMERIRALRPDCVLLDIRMPVMDGLELARAAADVPPIVFTTAFDQHAVQAFEADAVDYVLKPVQQARLEAALARVAARRAAADPARLVAMLGQIMAREAHPEPPRVTARSGRTARVFDAREIGRFRAADRYTLFRHRGEEFVLDESLAALEARLGPHGFLRVHRAELLNLHRVEAVSLEDSACVVTLRDGEEVPVSRRLVPELKRRLGMVEG